MAISDVLKSVCVAVGDSAPTAFYSAASSTIRKWQEMQMLANQAALMIADAYDWQALRKIAEMTGNGTAEAFTLPSSYRRMLKKASVWSSRCRWDMTHIVNSDDWLSFEFTTIGPLYGAWTIYGEKFHVQPIMQTDEKVKFFFVSSQAVRASNGDPKTAFSADTDTFILDENVLKLAIVYLWKQLKGEDFAAELADYEIAADQAYDSDGGSKPILSGNLPVNWRGRTVWPGKVSG
ncbi:hypothetical protein [Mesorhizobium sp. NPDC059025]|uniref:hypothetical protein n=1 Tax=unclassified Mesorhizobium TaxID=325217 RepID=UPI00368D4B45